MPLPADARASAMNESPPVSQPEPSATLRRWGLASIWLLAILAVASIVYAALSAVSGIVIPLVISTVIGMLATPLVDALERVRVPRPIGAVLVLIGILIAVVGSAALAVNGVIDQGDEISRQLTAGLERIDGWLQNLDVDAGVAEERVDQAKQFGVDLIPGLAGWFSSAFSGVVSFLAGCFIALFLLYYILVDWQRLRDWVGGHLGVPADLGRAAVDDATNVIRLGFSALTASSVVTAVIIGLTMIVLDLPLAFTVALVTFATSYIPYLGAIFSGAFAFLVALGAGGLTQALVLVAVILVVQNLVQTVITTKMTSDRLSLHPIASLVSTIVGVALAGLLGATLSAPVLAMTIRISRRVREYQPDQEGLDQASGT